MRRLAVQVAALVLGISGCINYLQPGEAGTPRYFAEMRGAAPLRVHAPISDDDGNVYILFGTTDPLETQAFIGHAAGGWSSSCKLSKGTRRVQGWVGHDKDYAYYWSGDALVEVSGKTSSCTSVLDTDPATLADLKFRAVIPYVWDRPSRRTMVALLQSPLDALPAFVVIDLDNDVYSNLHYFTPNDAKDVTVVGVGGNRRARVGALLVTYTEGGQPQGEGMLLDANGKITARVPVPAVAGLPVDSVQGFLGVTSKGLAAGLLSSGDVVTFDASSTDTLTVTGMTPVGVHLFDDALWVVGEDGSGPRLAQINGVKSLGAARSWTASAKAAQTLSGSLEVLNDRNPPRRWVQWDNVKTALGDYPFVTPDTPDVYALGETGWLIAGPSFVQSGAEDRTSVAFVPVGISYP